MWKPGPNVLSRCGNAMWAITDRSIHELVLHHDTSQRDIRLWDVRAESGREMERSEFTCRSIFSTEAEGVGSSRDCLPSSTTTRLHFNTWLQKMMSCISFIRALATLINLHRVQFTHSNSLLEITRSLQEQDWISSRETTFFMPYTHSLAHTVPLNLRFNLFKIHRILYSLEIVLWKAPETFVFL